MHYFKIVKIEMTEESFLTAVEDSVKLGREFPESDPKVIARNRVQSLCGSNQLTVIRPSDRTEDIFTQDTEPKYELNGPLVYDDDPRSCGKHLPARPTV